MSRARGSGCLGVGGSSILASRKNRKVDGIHYRLLGYRKVCNVERVHLEVLTIGAAISHRVAIGSPLASRVARAVARPGSHRSGRVHHNAPVVTSSQPYSESPIIAVSALLQLVGWAAARGQFNLQGGSSCLNVESSLFPPAPAPADATPPAHGAVAGASRRRSRPDSERSQPRRRRSSHQGSASSGGDA